MKIKYIILTIITLTILGACEPSHLEDNLLDSTVYFSRNGGNVANVSFYDVEGTHDYSFYAVNAGYYRGETNASITVEDSALDTYNEKNNTSFVALPSDCYTVTGQTGTITKDKNDCMFGIQFNCNALKALSQKSDYSDLQNYIVPIVLSTDGGIVASTDLNTLFVCPVMSQISVLAVSSGEITVSRSELTGTLTFDFPVATSIDNEWETIFDILTGNEATQRFNSTLLQRGTLEAYSSLVSTPSDAYIIDFNNTIEAGTSTAGMKVTVDASKVPEGCSSIVLFLNGATVSGEDVPVDGTPYLIIHFQNFDPVSTAGTVSIDDTSGDSGYLGKYLTNYGYTVISRDGWTFSPDSYHDNSYTKAIDGSTGSFWENRYNDSSTSYGPKSSLPFNAVFDFGQVKTFDAMELWRRSGYYVNDLRGFEIYVSDDNINWKYVTTVDYGTAKDQRLEITYFQQVSGRYVNLYMTKSNRGACASIAELFLWNK